ncbi:hypothetical protein MRX96_029811 [Rhipicephalus microplus]
MPYTTLSREVGMLRLFPSITAELVEAFLGEKMKGDPAYATGSELLKAGVIPGADMTPEAALTKLSFVIAHTKWTIEEKKENNQQTVSAVLDNSKCYVRNCTESLRGELTPSSERGFTGPYNAASVAPWKQLLLR